MADPPRPRHPLIVLVVDDHPDGAASCVHLPSLLGHPARTARTCAPAVASVEEFPPGLVLVEVGRSDGGQPVPVATLARVLDGRPVSGAVIWLADGGERARAAGFDHHFTKPLPHGVLAHLLEANAAGIKPDDGAAGAGRGAPVTSRPGRGAR